MKSHWLLVPAAASCLGFESPGPSHAPFTNVCRNLDVTPDTGLLSGDCITGKDSTSVRTSIDLNECLGWGPKEDGDPPNSLHPAKA